MQNSNSIKKRRRLEPTLETLEGKTLLSVSTGALIGPHAAHQAMTPSVVAQAAAQFSGTLTGFYSNSHIPFAGYLLSYSTSGNLTGVGSTHLNGTGKVYKHAGGVSRPASS